MKKKIAIVLSGLLLVLSMAGCGRNDSKLFEKIDTADLFNGISEDSLIEGSELSENFSAAMNEINEASNITVTADNNVILGEGDEAEKTNAKTTVKLSQENDVNTGSAVIENEYNGEKDTVSAYFDGTKLYFTTNDGDKVVEEMAYNDFMSVVNTYSLSIFDECIDKAACIEAKDGSKEYYMSYEPVSLESRMKANIEASGQSVNEGENMTVNYSNLYAKLDKDGKLVEYAYVLDATYSTDTDSQPYKYIVKADFLNMNKTKVDVVADTESYMTADEYTQMLQESANEAENADESNAEEENTPAPEETQAEAETPANQ